MTRAATEETHILEFGSSGRAVLKMTFQEREIYARLEHPAGLRRRDRRHLAKWLKKVIARFRDDDRAMGFTTICAGEEKFIGFELGGLVCGFYPS